MSFDIEAVNDVIMSLGYLQGLYLPFVPYLTRRHVSFLDTSANSTPRTFAQPWPVEVINSRPVHLSQHLHL